MGSIVYPPDNWPTKRQLDYTEKLIVVSLLVLALPYLVSKLLTNPGVVVSGVGRRVVHKGT